MMLSLPRITLRSQSQHVMCIQGRPRLIAVGGSSATLDNITCLSGNCGRSRWPLGCGSGDVASSKLVGRVDVRVASHNCAKLPKGFTISQGSRKGAAAAVIVRMLSDYRCHQLLLVSKHGRFVTNLVRSARCEFFTFFSVGHLATSIWNINV